MNSSFWLPGKSVKRERQAICSVRDSYINFSAPGVTEEEVRVTQTGNILTVLYPDHLHEDQTNYRLDVGLSPGEMVDKVWLNDGLLSVYLTKEVRTYPAIDITKDGAMKEIVEKRDLPRKEREIVNEDGGVDLRGSPES